MREASYRDRSAKELRAALKWGQKKLWLQDWTIDLLIDKADADEGLAKYRAQGCLSGVVRLFMTRHAFVGVWTENCQQENCDPLLGLFHELGHIATDWQVKPTSASPQNEFWLNTVATLMWELWTGRDGG